MKPKAVLLLALLVVVWGANWPILKMGMSHIQPFWFAAIRLTLGALSMFAIVAVFGKVRLPPRHDWPVVASLGLLSMSLFMILTNIAIQVVPAGRSAILAYTTPLWVAPGAALFLGERLGREKLFGLILGLGGLVTLFNPVGFDWSNRDTLLGNGLLLLAALAWAASILHVRGHAWSASPLELAPWQMLVGLVPVTAMAVIFEGPPQPDGSFELVWVLIYNGTLATAFAFWAAITVNRMLPAVTVSLSYLCIPAGGVAFSALMLGESLSLTNLAGLGLITAGVAAASLADRLRK